MARGKQPLDESLREIKPAAVDGGGDDPGQPLEVGVPDLPVKGMSLKTHTRPLLEFDSFVSSWKRLESLARDGHTDATVSLKFLTDVLTQDRRLSRIEIQGAVYNLLKVSIPGATFDSGNTYCGIRLWVKFPVLVMTEDEARTLNWRDREPGCGWG
jgi:hypothetical protein